MGNHHAGAAMARAAELLRDRRKPDESALDLLDAICEPYRRCDAEFDDSLCPGEPLGDLAAEALAPGVQFENSDEDDDAFYEQVIEPLCRRFEFC